jgi:hypothetical protein
MTFAADLKLGDTVKVRNLPGTRGKTFTVSRVDEKGIVHCWNVDHAYHAFPLANVEKVRVRT